MPPEVRKRLIDAIVNNCSEGTDNVLRYGFKGFAAFTDEALMRYAHNMIRYGSNWEVQQALDAATDYILLEKPNDY